MCLLIHSALFLSFFPRHHFFPSSQTMCWYHQVINIFLSSHKDVRTYILRSLPSRIFRNQTHKNLYVDGPEEICAFFSKSTRLSLPTHTCRKALLNVPSLQKNIPHDAVGCRVWGRIVDGRKGKNGTKREKARKLISIPYPSRIKYTFGIHECVHNFHPAAELLFACSIFLRLFLVVFSPPFRECARSVGGLPGLKYEKSLSLVVPSASITSTNAGTMTKRERILDALLSSTNFRTPKWSLREKLLVLFVHKYLCTSVIRMMPRDT